MEAQALARTTDGRLEQALIALRGRGLRASTARRLVLRALAAARGPATASAIASGLDGMLPRSDLGSVYRILDALEAAGVVERVHFGDGRLRYVLGGAATREHLLCESCGSAVAIDPSALDELRRQVRVRFGLTPSFVHFPLAGLCAACARSSSPSPAASSRRR